MRRSKFSYALRHARKGRKLVPCHGIRPSGGCTCRLGAKCASPGKHPRIKTGGDHLDAATDDPDQIRAWWGKWPDANIGIVTGAPSNLVVVDVDDPAALTRLDSALPDTYTVCSHGGRVHLYYEHPGYEVRLDSAGKIAPGVHFRGGGGLVVGAGSTHASGTQYRVINARRLVRPSDKLLRLLRENSAQRDGEDVYRADSVADSGFRRDLGPPSRHDDLVSLAARLVAQGATREFIEASLWARARKIKLPRREDDEVGRIIEWALGQQGHSVRVAKRVEALEIEDEARRAFARKRAGPPFELPEAGLTMADFLREERREQKYTIDQLHTAGGNTLLVASYKTGKTVLLLNLARALADGTPFLGQFDVAGVSGRVAISNYELTGDMLHEWVEDHRIEHPERSAYPLNMRARTRSLPLWDDDVSELVANWLEANEVQFWLVDPAARAWTGLVESEGNNVQIDLFTAALDEIKDRAGVEDLVLTTHMGRAKVEEDEERARGGTRLEDWMDHGWYMGKDGKTQDAPRWFRAMGRDVAVDAIALDWDPTQRWVTASGKTRAERRENVAEESVIEALGLHGPLNAGDLDKKARGLDKNSCGKPRDRLVER